MDDRIKVLDQRRRVPPCSIAIWRVPMFDVWVGSCDCGCWPRARDAQNAFGWFKSPDAVRLSAEEHLKRMDALRASDKVITTTDMGKL